MSDSPYRNAKDLEPQQSTRTYIANGEIQKKEHPLTSDGSVAAIEVHSTDKTSGSGGGVRLFVSDMQADKPK